MLHFRLLGTAAGGGLPQWNCACPLCDLSRKAPQRIPPRLQTQAAFSSRPGHWFLINASPDLRFQIESHPELCPCPARSRRNTPIAAILLTCADLDQVLGLLLLREFQPLTLYATPLVRRILEANSFFRMLTRLPQQLTWVEIAPHRSFALDDVTCTPLPMPGSLPHYAREFEGAPHDQANLGFLLEADGVRLAYTPSLPALTDAWKSVYAASDVILVDGTFWSDAELNRTHSGTPFARSIGHLPMSGPGGTIALLSGITRPRKLFVHINNTNPVLDPESPQSAFVRDQGWELSYDGWQLN